MRKPCLGMIKKLPFLLMFPQGSVHLQSLSTGIPKPAGSFWLFMWKIHLRQWLVKCVEKILRKNWESQKKTFNNTMNIFLIPRKRFKNILQHQKVYILGSFPSSPTYSVTTLNSTALIRLLKLCKITLAPKGLSQLKCVTIVYLLLKAPPLSIWAWLYPY